METKKSRVRAEEGETRLLVTKEGAGVGTKDPEKRGRRLTPI